MAMTPEDEELARAALEAYQKAGDLVYTLAWVDNGHDAIIGQSAKGWWLQAAKAVEAIVLTRRDALEEWERKEKERLSR